MSMRASLAVVRTVALLASLAVASAARGAPPAEGQTARIVGVYRSEKNPALREKGLPGRFSIVEERIHFGADGTVCGVDAVLDRSGGMYPFHGRYTVRNGRLTEDYSAGTPPLSLGERKSRDRAMSFANGTLKLGPRFPGHYERVDAATAGTFRFVDQRNIPIEGLPPECFRL